MSQRDIETTPPWIIATEYLPFVRLIQHHCARLLKLSGCTNAGWFLLSSKWLGFSICFGLNENLEWEKGTFVAFPIEDHTMEKSFTAAVDEELTCSLCLDIFVEPKVLPGCEHVFCAKCLRILLPDKRKDQPVRCPECREGIQISKDGVSKLKTNLKLRNLAERRRRDISGERQTDQKSDTAMCSLHEGETMRLYCVKCRSLACQCCMLENHTGMGHYIVGLEDKFEEQKRQVTRIRTKIDKSQENLQKIQLEIEQLKNSQETVEQQISKFTQRRLDQIKKEDWALRDKLKKGFEPKLKELEHNKAKVKRDIASAKRIYATIQQAMRNKPKHDYVLQHDSLIAKMKTLEICEPKIGSVSAKFVQKPSGNSVSGDIIITDSKRTFRQVTILIIIWFCILCAATFLEYRSTSGC